MHSASTRKIVRAEAKRDALAAPFISIVRTCDLVPHEKLDEKHYIETRDELKYTGILRRPIAVHRIAQHRYPDLIRCDRFLILDGHHRAAAVSDLGYGLILARLVDLFSRRVGIKSWDGERSWPKRQLEIDALEGRLREPQTTKHVVRLDGKEIPFHHYEPIEPLINYPLKHLKRGNMIW